MKPQFWVYDPADLAAVAQGSVSPSSVRAKSQWDVQFPGVTYPDGYSQRCHCATYEPATKTLYVCVKDAWWDGYEGHPMVYAFSVNC
jgi:hypothetical protein